MHFTLWKKIQKLNSKKTMTYPKQQKEHRLQNAKETRWDRNIVSQQNPTQLKPAIVSNSVPCYVTSDGMIYIYIYFYVYT